jgi:beta-lactamase class A
VSITWAACDLGSGRRIDDDGDISVVSASLIKLPIMLAVLLEVDAARMRLGDELELAGRHRVGGSGWLTDAPVHAATVATLVQAMIDSSDNAATNVLLDAVGYDAVNAAAQRAGMHGTVIRRHMMDAGARRAGRENVTTATDVCALLCALAGGTLLTPRSQRVAYDALLAQQLPGGLASCVPAGLSLGHKTGELDGIRHDAGLLFRSGTPIVALAVCGSGVPGDEAQLDRQIAERGRAICEQLGLMPSPPT